MTVLSFGYSPSTLAFPKAIVDTPRPPSPAEAKPTFIFSAPEIAAGFRQLYDLDFLKRARSVGATGLITLSETT
jgi:hypothetical protein